MEKAGPSKKSAKPIGTTHVPTENRLLQAASPMRSNTLYVASRKHLMIGEQEKHQRHASVMNKGRNQETKSFNPALIWKPDGSQSLPQSTQPTEELLLWGKSLSYKFLQVHLSFFDLIRCRRLQLGRMLTITGPGLEFRTMNVFLTQYCF